MHLGNLILISDKFPFLRYVKDSCVVDLECKREEGYP